MKAFIDIKTSFEEGSAVLEAMARKPLSDRPAFREIAEKLGAGVESRFHSAQADSPETYERKSWGSIHRSGNHGASGSMTSSMFSSGNSFARLQQRSTDVSAAVKRGTQEWWLFLHDRGKGYAYWTVDDANTRKSRAKRKVVGTREQKRAAERRSGVVTYPARPIFYITAAEEAWALDRVTKAVDDSLQRTADGSAV